ncbi:glutamyl-tRNA reductase [Candidatus Nitrososphaera gargensis Ga9.2]|uniref:Glutamyl-tRNA reductase n=1 Tax=Nitrososphaera gargensis (strain Ga9.2) TaxID=1237085 RepID=K0IJD3_NITGG|nr:glutamyl-tRNA reductase [Candidatus Nitrososphaera gargensis]AFU59233.1 glutamyl-tRNA reductase [Candidatus Nitrososphaera gargensis Ga9.2]
MTTAAIKAAPSPTSSPTVAPVHIVNARVTYRNAPIHLLEKFTFKDIDGAHKAFLKKAGFEECVILQTCNRIEVFAASKNPDEGRLLEEWASAVGLPEKDFANVEVSRGREAVMHLMKLTSGLDSLVVGEDQILGQVRRAVEFSRSGRYASANLSLIFDRALKVGSRVRTATGINRGNVSIASVAVNLAEEYFDDLKSKTIMLIGTGEAASLVAKVLKKRNVNFMVTSRAPERARSFAETVAGTPIPFDSALEMLRKVDLIFTATVAPYRLLTFNRIENAMKNNRRQGMMIFDLSNPRTVDEKVATIHGVKLVNMDQIAELVGKNMRSRMKEISSAEKLIEDEMKSVDMMMKRMKAEPVVVSVFKNVDTIRERELKKALAMLGKKLGPEETKIVEQLSYAIVEGILSTPMNNLRKVTEEGESEELMKIVAKLFKYEEKQQQ